MLNKTCKDGGDHPWSKMGQQTNLLLQICPDPSGPCFWLLSRASPATLPGSVLSWLSLQPAGSQQFLMSPPVSAIRCCTTHIPAREVTDPHCPPLLSPVPAHHVTSSDTLYLGSLYPSSASATPSFSLRQVSRGHGFRSDLGSYTSSTEQLSEPGQGYGPLCAGLLRLLHRRRMSLLQLL